MTRFGTQARENLSEYTAPSVATMSRPAPVKIESSATAESGRNALSRAALAPSMIANETWWMIVKALESPATKPR